MSSLLKIFFLSRHRNQSHNHAYSSETSSGMTAKIYAFFEANFTKYLGEGFRVLTTQLNTVATEG
jgi:hypothetical protein